MSSRCINKVILIGNVGSNKYYDESKGNPILIFDLATDRSWVQKSTGKKMENTSWHKIVAFGGLASAVNDLIHTGGRVFVSGRLEYEQKEEGVQSAQIVAGEIIILDRGAENQVEYESSEEPEDMEIVIPDETIEESE